MAAVMAFNVSGRLNVTVMMRPALSNLMYL